ncbi:MAG: VOC family protein [Comamonadaceae bacterium]|nr:VOC family protein [Burkholderiales bacterium]MEB2348691.1 VOC family protein [Comamonadaceae bacterium]
MQNASTWFEIPVRDLAAAQRFYETLLGRPMQGPQDMGGEHMAVFAHDRPGAGGCLVQRDGHHAAPGGVMIYLDSAPSVQTALDRAQAAGGRVVTPRTLIAPGIGYFAHVADMDGNVVGLHAAD